jgi:hypothetical protein
MSERHRRSKERLQILRILEQGKISAKEAAELLAAVDRPRAEEEAAAVRGRWMRVRVTDIRTGKVKVNVRVPMGLLDVGLRMGARFMPKTSSVDPQELLGAIRSGQTGKIVDLEDQEDGEHVEIYID